MSRPIHVHCASSFWILTETLLASLLFLFFVCFLLGPVRVLRMALPVILVLMCVLLKRKRHLRLHLRHHFNIEHNPIKNSSSLLMTSISLHHQIFLLSAQPSSSVDQSISLSRV